MDTRHNGGDRMGDNYGRAINRTMCKVPQPIIQKPNWPACATPYTVRLHIPEEPTRIRIHQYGIESHSVINAACMILKLYMSPDGDYAVYRTKGQDVIGYMASGRQHLNDPGCAKYTIFLQ